MYEINSIAALASEEILKNERILKEYVKETNVGKKFLINQLKNLNLNYHETYANFLHVNFQDKKSQLKVFKYLNKKGILVRFPPNIKSLSKSFEVYFRTTELYENFSKEFEKIY